MRKFVCDICGKDIVMDPQLAENMIDVVFEVIILQRNEDRFNKVISTVQDMHKETCRECKDTVKAFVINKLREAPR